VTDRLTATRPGPTAAQVRGSRRGYAALRGVSALVAALMLTGAGLSLVPTMARQDATSTVALADAAPSDVGPVGAVLIEAERGDVMVRETRGGEAPSVSASSRWAFREPELNVGEGPDGRLRVAAPCPTGNWGTCSVDFEVTVPAGTSVEVRGSVGDVDVVSTGDVTVVSSLGDVNVGGDPGRVRVETSLGQVRVVGSPGSVEAQASLGGIRVLAQEPPDLVTATTSLGDVHVEVPGGVAYAVDVDSSQGDQDVRVDRDPESRHLIRARASLGSIRVIPGR
jgi:hypothetical protein